MAERKKHMRPSRLTVGARSRSVALVVSGLVGSCVLSAFGCGGIDEPDLFAPAGGGTTQGDGGGGSDARSDAHGGGKDGGVVIDSGKLPPAGTVQCTSGNCSIADNQVCCYGATKTGTCTSQDGCSGVGSFPIPCDSAQDCADEGQPGTICCAQADQTGAVTNVECVDPSNCQSSNGQTNLCDPSADNPCPNGGTCSASTVSIPGYDICKM